VATVVEVELRELLAESGDVLVGRAAAQPEVLGGGPVVRTSA
jgi:hypothetical protein